MTGEPKPYYAREPRSDLRLPAKLYFDGREGIGELINISLSGGFLCVDNLPDAYTVLAMSVAPPVGDPLFFHATVIRSQTLAVLRRRADREHFGRSGRWPVGGKDRLRLVSATFRSQECPCPVS
jgi:hypothetical protein